MDETTDQPFRVLSDEEQSLLAAACEPFRLLGQVGDGTKWPVWDFVARTFGNQSRSRQLPEEVLAGLPAGVSLRPDRRTYRLFWLGEVRHDGVPWDRDTFGLTIAGMHALRLSYPPVGDLADQLATYIGALAREADSLPPSPFKAAEWDAPLSEFTGGSIERGQPLPFKLSAAAAAAVLRNESVFISVVERQHGWACNVSGRSLRPFLGITSAEEYLAIAWNIDLPAASTSWSSPLTLIQTIDYFGYVLEGTSWWPSGLGHPVRPRSFSAAASLGLAAETREEFESRISGLCTVIDQFTLPEIPDEIKKRNFGGADGSINRLAHFIRTHVSQEPYQSDAETALAALRDLRHIRVGQQHDSAAKRAAAAGARARFGLAPITESWDADWNAIRVHVASAFGRIIDALQGSDQKP